MRPDSPNEICGERLNLKAGQEVFKPTPTNGVERLEEESVLMLCALLLLCNDYLGGKSLQNFKDVIKRNKNKTHYHLIHWLMLLSMRDDS